MTYVKPPDLAEALISAGESKIIMATRDTLIRAYMAGAILTLGAAFAVKVTVDTNSPILGAILFPVGFCLLYLLGYDLLTGVFVLVPLAYAAQRVRVRIQTWNDNPRPYVWVKTADQILESIAHYCERIKDSGH